MHEKFDDKNILPSFIVMLEIVASSELINIGIAVQMIPESFFPNLPISIKELMKCYQLIL